MNRQVEDTPDMNSPDVHSPVRVLVTGSRDWDDRQAIGDALINLALLHGPGQVTVVHGDCPTGADHIADSLSRSVGMTIERHPADWHRYGKRAGAIRNTSMVNLGADLCLAFIRDGSSGASHCAAVAERAGITVRIFTATTRQICTACGTAGPVENHHPGGREDWPDLTAPVCLDCHQILSGWQSERNRARIRDRVGKPPFWHELAAGFLDVLTLTAARSGICDHVRGLPGIVARFLREAYGIGEPWPVSTGPVSVAVIAPEPGSEPERLTALLGIVRTLLDALGIGEPYAEAIRHTDAQTLMRATGPGSTWQEHADSSLDALRLIMARTDQPGPGIRDLITYAESEVDATWKLTAP